MTSKKEFNGRQMSDALYRPCKALPVHLICSNPHVTLGCKAAFAICNIFLLRYHIGLKARHWNRVGHYLHSLERSSEAAAAYEAAAAACAPACALSGARRAAELYRGLALLSTGAPADLEAACGLLHQHTRADAADSTTQVAL